MTETRPLSWPVVVVAAAVAGLAVAGPAGAPLGIGAAVVARGVLRRRARRAAVDAVRASIPAVCRMVAAELRAGAPPAAALAAAAEIAPGDAAAHLRRVSGAVTLGVDPGAALAHGPPGAEGLALLAACWRVSAGTGAGLADAAERVGRALAAEERRRREIAAQLAGPRASATVLAVLPLAGIALASGLGAQPARFFATPLGAGCLAAGIALDAAGLAWTGRLARRALR